VVLNFSLLQAAFFLQAGVQGNPYVQLLPLLLLFAVFYLLIFMPMQRQKKNQKQMLASLENGNIVLTSGGIVGTIVAIEADDTLVLRVKPDNIKIQVARSAVSSVVSGEGKK
jgi:preprotein translocase subunit YajC